MHASSILQLFGVTQRSSLQVQSANNLVLP